MSFESIHNYYEKLVRDELEVVVPRLKIKLSESAIEDVACVALNSLPPRYIKHDVDALFFMSREEKEEMINEVYKKVEEAIKIVSANPKEED
jgi:hypothetical protein